MDFAEAFANGFVLEKRTHLGGMKGVFHRKAGSFSGKEATLRAGKQAFRMKDSDADAMECGSLGWLRRGVVSRYEKPGRGNGSPGGSPSQKNNNACDATGPAPPRSRSNRIT